MAWIITLLIFLSAIAFLFYQIKKSQDADVAEMYMSTDEAGCKEVHQKFWYDCSGADVGLGVDIPLNQYCTVCEKYR